MSRLTRNVICVNENEIYDYNPIITFNKQPMDCDAQLVYSRRFLEGILTSKSGHFDYSFGVRSGFISRFVHMQDCKSLCGVVTICDTLTPTQTNTEVCMMQPKQTLEVWSVRATATWASRVAPRSTILWNKDIKFPEILISCNTGGKLRRRADVPSKIVSDLLLFNASPL